MDAASFDLTTRPWIRVRRPTGAVDELSLIEVFAEAHGCVSLAGELPTQDFAVLRLLLAILHRSRPGSRGTAGWALTWEREAFDAEAIRGYVSDHRDRFDLIHPSTPFYQVAGLSTAKGAAGSLSGLVADVPAGHQYFATRSGRDLQTMEYAEAARWVVHCQAFDVSGIKSGAVGDPRVKGGKGYPIGLGWCGNLGGVVVEGANLFETLMLNYRTPPRRYDEDGAVWERPAQTAASELPRPKGPVDLLTWQSRRIRLAHKDGVATGVVIANGDPLHQRNMMDLEAMTSWRYSEPQTKAHGGGDPVFMPQEHSRDRAIWRGLAGLLAEAPPVTSRAHTPPEGGWLKWLDELHEDELLEPGRPLRVRAVGMHYGSNNSVIDDVADDALSLRAAILARRQLRTLALDAVRDADLVARRVAGLCSDLAEAAGLSGDRLDEHRRRGREQTYALLDHPYRRWLAETDPADEVSERRLVWQRRMVELVMPWATRLAVDAGPVAWTGREVHRLNDRTIYLDAGLADLTFRRRLRADLPDVHPASPPSPETSDAPGASASTQLSEESRR